MPARPVHDIVQRLQKSLYLFFPFISGRHFVFDIFGGSVYNHQTVNESGEMV
jgi:hypothetical protein